MRERLQRLCIYALYLLSHEKKKLPHPISWKTTKKKQVAAGGATVRKGIDRNSTFARMEPPGAVLLLMGPSAPCGSFCVYGGWVGGPGREEQVRLVREIGDYNFTRRPCEDFFFFQYWFLCFFVFNIFFYFLLFYFCLVSSNAILFYYCFNNMSCVLWWIKNIYF